MTQPLTNGSPYQASTSSAVGRAESAWSVDPSRKPCSASATGISSVTPSSLVSASTATDRTPGFRPRRRQRTSTAPLTATSPSKRRMVGPAPLAVGRVDGADPRRPLPARLVRATPRGGAQSHRRLSHQPARHRQAATHGLHPGASCALLSPCNRRPRPTGPPAEGAHARVGAHPRPSGLGTASPFGPRLRANTRLFPPRARSTRSEHPQLGLSRQPHRRALPVTPHQAT